MRADASVENGLALFLVSDNLRKGAALNAIQIAELLVGAALPSYFGSERASRRRAEPARAPAGTPPAATRSTFSRLPSTHRAAGRRSSSRASSTRPGRAHRPEAEVGEEVAREDRAVDEEALVAGLALAVAVGERLERPRALVARLADRGEEERLLDPRLRLRRRGTRR